ncbi:MAG: peptidase domain-containing ABC transporter [Cyclobacteriaceae bacterium]|nr:MAG: peptidase domain-containing ABC transporter [Cyclobacteriaceae bacterium]
MFKKFPFYKQLDTMDCGPTCLRMISKYYGKVFTLNELRNKAYITREGVSMLGISDAAEAIGFHTLGVKLTFDQLLTEAQLPCIIHWNQSHFVVVYAVKKDKVFVADPGSSLLIYNRPDFEKCWLTITEANGSKAGLALLLVPTPAFYEKEPDRVETKIGFASLFGYIRKYKRLVFQLFIGLLLGSLIQLMLPFLTQSIIDVGINTRNVNFIYLILAGQLMLFISRSSVEFIRRWILLHLSTRINISFISDFLLKLLKLPLSFFDSKMIGDLLQRIEDYNRIERFLSTSTLSILFSFFNLVVFGAVLLFYNINIFLVFFILSGLYVVYTLLFMKKRAELDYKRFQQFSHNQSNLIQLINGMPDIKINNCETTKRWEWERIQAKILKLSISNTKLAQVQDAGSLFINELKNIIITIIAAMAVIEGQMTLGMMLAVQYIIGQLNAPLNEFITFTRSLQDAKLSFSRISEIHELKNEDSHLQNFFVDDLSFTSKSLIIKDVSFQYEGPHSPKVLDSVDLIIPEGKVTAIVGASGSGKTTLMKLLLKFYQPMSGSISVGGIDLAGISSSHWRKQCGVVLQDGYLFADTILKNIALSDEAIDKQKLLHAVDIANIKDFIESLPLGYSTKVGSNGVGLSQGQKQRILVARAVYKNPEFLFLDEATSALDAENERKIIDNLNEFFKGRTVVVIAHRLSTVKNADQIVVISNGKIKEVGTHEQLAKSKGVYYNLVRNQLELGD